MTQDQRRPLRWAAIAGLWLLIAAAFTLSWYGTYTIKGEEVSLGQLAFEAVLEWILWGLLAPLILILAHRAPLTTVHWPRNLVIHVIGWAAALAVHESLYVVIDRLSGMADPTTRSLAQDILLYITKRSAFGLLVYSGLVGLAHALDVYRRFRERELAATQLQNQLARSQLQVLRSQVQPHFLFNTLNTISALMRQDVDAADRVVTRLGDLLRFSLQHTERQEVPLRRELEFLESYLDIQRTRFRDRLTVAIDAAPDTLDALVPTLVLQPLVENAIRYAIEPRATAGRIEVRTRRDGDRLTLAVSDDGPGLETVPPETANGTGIGLTNTRARLAQLYGEHQSFELGRGELGGLAIHMTLPFRTGSQPTPIHGLTSDPYPDRR